MRFQGVEEGKTVSSEGRTAQLVKVASRRAEILELKSLVALIDTRTTTLLSDIEALLIVRKQKQDFPSYREVNVKRHLVKTLRDLSKGMVSKIAEARLEITDDDSVGKSG